MGNGDFLIAFMNRAQRTVIASQGLVQQIFIGDIAAHAVDLHRAGSRGPRGAHGVTQPAHLAIEAHDTVVNDRLIGVILSVVFQVFSKEDDAHRPK